MGKTNYNTMRANMPKLSREFDNWEFWTRNDIPQLAGRPLRVRCTWAEAFYKPFRIRELLSANYGRNSFITYRQSAIEDLILFFDSPFWRENMTAEEVIAGNPNNFIFRKNTTPTHIYIARWVDEYVQISQNIWQRFISIFGRQRYTETNIEVNKNIRIRNKFNAVIFPIGEATGRYYVDIFGFIWVEMWGNFQENERQLCWVRWLSVDLSRDNANLHNLLREKRAQIMQEREEHEHAQEVSDEKTKRNLTYLGAGALFLASSRL